MDSVSKSRSDRATALEAWADNVDTEDLKEADTSSLRQVAVLAENGESSHVRPPAAPATDR